MDTRAADTNSDQHEFVDAVETWVEKELRPVARKFDLADEYPHEIVEQMKALGLFGATIGEAYGGLGLSAWTYAQIVIKVASVWMAPSGIFNSHLIVASAIERNGTDEQKRKYLPRMASGELRASIGLTEPNAGSDLQAIRTTARLDGDDYVVNGSKMWISNSLHGHFTLLLVKTDPQAQPRHRGMSLLIAEKGPGYEGAKRLIEQAARKYDRGERCDLEAAMAKLAGSEAGAFCAQEGMRIFGGYSYSVEYDIERFYRDAMLMCIGEGTNEILRQVIARQLVERNRI